VAGAQSRLPGRPPDRRRAVGARGEALAAARYEAAGYEVLDRNWRCREGELDLVLGGDGVVVFCEVKTRRGAGFGDPAEAVTATKQRRIRGLAARWLAEHRVRAPVVRFDVASVRLDPGTKPRVDVITGAF
jgi:putative endonuclease